MGPLLLTGIASLLFGFALSTLVGAMAEGDGASGLFSRKIFHACVFSGAVPAQLLQGFWGVVVYGTVLSFLILLALLQGSGSPLYRALARAPGKEGEAGDILKPLVSTALGGLLSVLLVGRFAVVGYLVCGWGDAVGEPVGRRWGRRTYRSPFPWGRGSVRSAEGSLAVLLVASVGGGVALSLLGHAGLRGVGAALACGAVGAAAEGISGSDTDNLWVQLLPSLTALWLLG